VRFWVGVTDSHWFGFLKEHLFEEVNFWQPNPRVPFLNATAGMPFLFKLKRPHHHIAGGGFLIAYTHLPLSLAWEIFGEKNGAPTCDALEDRIRPLNRTHQRDPEIGCTLLANPFFWDPGDWLENPPG
jgi:putative restriction endonuclease